MKLFKILSGLLLTILSVLVVLSCRNDDELFQKTNPKNIAELTSENAELSTFSSALIRVKLDSVLSTSTTFTVFAPKNDAFSSIDLSTLSDDVLKNVLLNHVRTSTTADFISTMSTGYSNTLAIGPDGNNLSLYTNVIEEDVSINGKGTVVDNMKDIGATNGVIHIVDGLLSPPTVVGHVLANPEYSSLAAALTKVDLAKVLNDNDKLFTVFAPNNAAFEKFMMDVGVFGWKTLDDIPKDILEQVLLYHVVADENILTEDTDGTEQTTMESGSFSISGTKINDATPTDANINLTDIQGFNGIIHGIDKVLLPEEIYQSILSVTLNMAERAANKGFMDFLAALDKVDLTTSFSSDEFTAFVPNNDAFLAFFATIDNFNGLEDFDTPEELEVLKQLLQYHLLTEELMASGFTDGGTITTVNGDVITVDLGGDEPRLKPSLADAIPSIIVSTNIGASNGIIHALNRVLVPEALAGSLGIETGGPGGLQTVGNPDLVFFDWNTGDTGHWWDANNVVQENDAAISLDGTDYGRSNFNTGSAGWMPLFFRNSGTMQGASVVANNLNDYSLKFDINILEPISAGKFIIRFKDGDGIDAEYDWAPWKDIGEPFDTDGWITIEIPLSVMPQTDYSLVDEDFGMAFFDDNTDVKLNYAIDNVRFDSPGGGVDPVADPNLVFFDWNTGDTGHWWDANNVVQENDAAISLDGTDYGRSNFNTGSAGWMPLFFRNSGTMQGASVVANNLNDYSLKFDINILEPISAGKFIIRFKDGDGIDAEYDWAPWKDIEEPFDTDGWITIEIPLSVMPQTDYSLVDEDFGMAFFDDNIDVKLNYAIDNVRFEKE